MFAKYYRVLIFLAFISCTNEFFPENLYDYQVERLLSAGNIKEWNRVVNSENCQDSIRLLIELIPSTSDDSVAISEILRGSSCSPDTSFVGNADASSFSDAIIFTDTLNFAVGDFWIIESITTKSLTAINNSETVIYTSN